MGDYARLSTDGQDLDPQTGELRKDSFDVLAVEKASGASRRPEFGQAVRRMRADDILEFVRIDRLVRSVNLGGVDVLMKMHTLLLCEDFIQSNSVG